MFIVMIKWENDLEISVGDWYAICSLTFCITKNTKLQNRQFKSLLFFIQLFHCIFCQVL
jgi:hypothetical protein